MTEQDRVEETREKIHRWLQNETNEDIKIFKARFFKWKMLPFFLVMGICMGSAEAIWSNLELVMLFGGFVFSTAGALVIALMALPKNKTILDMGVTYVSGNKSLVYELRKNKIIARWGIFLIFIGYMCFSAELAIRLLGFNF